MYRVSWNDPYPTCSGQRSHKDFESEKEAEHYAGFIKELDPFPGSYQVKVEPI